MNIKFKYEYQIQDHLGNLRVAFRCSDPKRDAAGNIIATGQPGAGKEPVMIVQQNHYDPWGLNFGIAATENQKPSSLNNRYQYNNKEKLTDLGIGWNDYGARMNMSDIGRWNGVDPLAEKYPSYSPYNYCLNNPINAIDPDGFGNAGPKDAFSGPIAKYQVFKNLTEDDVVNWDPSGMEGKIADGVIKLNLGYKDDMEAIADIKSHMKSNKEYTSVTNNCSDLACSGVAEALDTYKSLIKLNGANESAYGINYTTPNSLYKYVSGIINSNSKEGKELRNPGAVIDTKFKDFIKAPDNQQGN